jgi:hypothetical protein
MKTNPPPVPPAEALSARELTEELSGEREASVVASATLARVYRESRDAGERTR